MATEVSEAHGLDPGAQDMLSGPERAWSDVHTRSFICELSTTLGTSF